MDLPIALYAALFCATILAPIKWSLAAFFWLANVDLPDVDGGFSVFNILKAFLLPLYLLWRLRRSPGNVALTPGGLAWIAFTAYVGTAGLSSQFPAAALKFVGHLTGSLLICVVLVKAVAGRKLGAEAVPLLALGIFVLAVLRRIFLPSYGDSLDRFASFVPAQAFAAFAAALYCILLFAGAVKPWIRFSTLGALAIAVILNGSRIWGLSLILATVLSFLFSNHSRHWKILGAIASCLALTALITFPEAVLAYIAEQSGNNRIAAAITAFQTEDVQGGGLGTFRFRKQINELAIRQIADSSSTQLIFGHGTSNAAVITGSIFEAYYAMGQRMDPNRMLHNEWLRVIYEWGLLGSALWLGFVGSVFVLAWKRVHRRNGGAAKALCVYLPGFLFALAGENILAGAGNAVNMGFLLVLALAYTPSGILLPLTSCPTRPNLRPQAACFKEAVLEQPSYCHWR